MAYRNPFHFALGSSFEGGEENNLLAAGELASPSIFFRPSHKLSLVMISPFLPATDGTRPAIFFQGVQ
jgi:hypothetical protein